MARNAKNTNTNTNEVKTENMEVKKELDTNEIPLENLPKIRKGFHIDEHGNEVEDLLTFVDEDGNEKTFKEEDLPKMNQELVKEHFKKFVDETTFAEVAENPVWNIPYIGKHETGVYKVFTRETGVNFKRFILEKFTKEEMQEYAKTYRSDLLTCNAFLRNIAIDKQLVKVHAVKDTLNNINNELLHVFLTCTNDNDEEYQLTCTNTMVRVMLVDKAKSNTNVDGFKQVKIADLFEVVLKGLSKKYLANKE